MDSREPSVTSTDIRKLRPQAKLPTASVVQQFSAEEVNRLKRLLTEPAEYVVDEMYDRPGAEEFLLRPLELPYDGEFAADGSDDSGVYGLGGPNQASTKANREQFLFLRLNYCRRKVYRILDEHGGRRLNFEASRDLLRWGQAVHETRSEIVRENLPLVLAMAKRTRILGVDITDLISEGNLALLRSVNKFDCSRGFRFSTYACRAILKSFSRVATRMARYRGHFPTEFDPLLEKSDYIEQRRKAAKGDTVHELKSILGDNLAHLSEVEQKVILARFALDQADDTPIRKAKTLEQVGQMIGVTKERVRQIQNKALTKLRTALEGAALAR